MPKSIERKRHVKYYRTIKPKKGRYIHIAIVKKPGPRGGHTIAGPVHKVKSKRKRHRKYLKKDIL